MPFFVGCIEDVGVAWALDCLPCAHWAAAVKRAPAVSCPLVETCLNRHLMHHLHIYASQIPCTAGELCCLTHEQQYAGLQQAGSLLTGVRVRSTFDMNGRVHF